MNKTKHKLNITFHDPNPPATTLREMLKIAAELAKAKVEQEILDGKYTKACSISHER